MLRRVIPLLLIIAIPAFATSQPVLAHERREVGKYTFVVGWNEEPALEGLTNAVFVRVTETSSNKAIEGLESTLRVAVSYGGSVTTYEPALRAVRGTPGSYTADIVPTRAGDYTFRLSGKVEGTEIDQRFESGPGRFNPITAQSDLQFPEKVSSPLELSRQSRAAIDYAETTRTFFIGSLALSGMAVLLAGAALVQVRRRS